MDSYSYDSIKVILIASGATPPSKVSKLVPILFESDSVKSVTIQQSPKVAPTQTFCLDIDSATDLDDVLDARQQIQDIVPILPIKQLHLDELPRIELSKPKDKPWARRFPDGKKVRVR